MIVLPNHGLNGAQIFFRNHSSFHSDDSIRRHKLSPLRPRRRLPLLLHPQRPGRAHRQEEGDPRHSANGVEKIQVKVKQKKDLIG